VLGRMGNNDQALHLIIERLGDIPRVSECVRHCGIAASSEVRAVCNLGYRLRVTVLCCEGWVLGLVVGMLVLVGVVRVKTWGLQRPHPRGGAFQQV
jgi:hypothetical protein